MANIPADLRYTKDHEWVKVEGETATIGITDYAQHALGDVVYVDLPSVGKSFKAHETIGSIESVKAVSDVFTPVSGEITEVNESLGDTPENVNEDAYGAWIAKFKLDNAAEVEELMDAKSYEEFVEANS
ncbi:MAG: glycine cleavage system protein GcvH [Pyrinomonadaceae bacterium]|nr:glycine cleavage system protein GcvH [Pyrinomonadaceae bacterium]